MKWQILSLLRIRVDVSVNNTSTVLGLFFSEGTFLHFCSFVLICSIFFKLSVSRSWKQSIAGGPED